MTFAKHTSSSTDKRAATLEQKRSLPKLGIVDDAHVLHDYFLFSINMNTHRLSGVRCPEAVDVPVPKAPPPPEHVREESPFGGPRGGAASSSSSVGGAGGARGKSAAAASSKPKGKAIAPKDFFAAATAGAGKGKAKGKGGAGGGGGAKAAAAAAKEEKDAAAAAAAKKKAGGIGSFFGKGELVGTIWKEVGT